ncbi:hypothetical protein CCS01_23835 [Rhodopila globiformis]|uniref:Response regulatory domain-containing protein n=1 Tax=Rhodopila globiformis TaxID=1071 RepID=A0A2S6N1Z6_RHOGL|nr:hypothetical protein CCS01_23835 [Rhodopila globiformis]
MIAALLAERGYAVIQTRDGPAGLRIVQSAARLDLLLSDVGLPGLNGRQLPTRPARAGRVCRCCCSPAMPARRRRTPTCRRAWRSCTSRSRSTN